ncbi:MAG: hypothetical protein SNJ64_01190 [Endomicrobiia bacterium]
MDFNKYTFHLTQNEKLFVEETLKILSIRNPGIYKELNNFVESIKEPKDKVSCGKQVVNFLFKKRYPVITKKLKLLNKLKLELKKCGIKLSYDKMLEQNPKIILADGLEVRCQNYEDWILKNSKFEKSRNKSQKSESLKFDVDSVIFEFANWQMKNLKVVGLDTKTQELINRVFEIFHSGI